VLHFVVRCGRDEIQESMQILNSKPDGRSQSGRFWQRVVSSGPGAEGRRERRMTKQTAAIRNFLKEPKSANFGHLSRSVTIA